MAPAGAAAHRGQEARHRAHRAENVHSEQPRPVVFGEPVDASELLHADVGAEEIATAELLVDAGRRVAHRGRVAHIYTHRRGGDAHLGELGSCCLRSRLVDVESNDGHAGISALSGDRSPQT